MRAKRHCANWYSATHVKISTPDNKCAALCKRKSEVWNTASVSLTKQEVSAITRSSLCEGFKLQQESISCEVFLPLTIMSQS